MPVGFVEQAWGYFFERSDEGGVPDGPVGGRAAWRGVELEPSEWQIELTPPQVAELDEALARVASSGVSIHDLTADLFPLPTLAREVRSWADEVACGRGFVLIRGLPVDRWGDETTALAYWGLGQHLGRPGAQNPAGDLLGHVVDEGNDPADLGVRLYTTAGSIRFHCDAADAVGLMCLRNSAEGGLSRISSSVAVLDEMWHVQPELARRMFEPFEMDTRGDGDDLRHFAVTPACFDGSRVRICFHGDYYRTVARHPDVGPLDPIAAEALDLFEAIAERPDVRLDMVFRPGDIQLISNHTVVHARTGYTDGPAAPRHLLRLWLTLAGA